MRPEGWFWAHDIAPAQLDSVLMPGTRLVRLSRYGPRFAALVYTQAGADRGYALDLDAGALASRLRETGVRPVAITVSDDGEDARYSVVFETGPGPAASVHLDLAAAELAELSDDQHAIADLATYRAGGRRLFAAVRRPRTGPSWLFTGLEERGLTARLRQHDLAPVRLRAYREDGRPVLAAVAEPAGDRRRAWYTDLDGDAVARKLERNAAYPTDLDATRGEDGVRFTVTMTR